MRYGLLFAVVAMLVLGLLSGHAQAQGQQATAELKAKLDEISKILAA